MNIDQFNVSRAMKIEAGKEWDKTEGLKVPKQTFIKYLSKNNFYNVGKERF